MPYLVDSDILIDISRGKEPAQEFIDSLPEGWGLSQVSAMELIVGARDNREVADLNRFLAAFVIVPLSSTIGAKAYQLLTIYARSHGLHVFDSLVAATAIEENLTLITRNRKHFAMIAGLSMEIPEY